MSSDPDEAARQLAAAAISAGEPAAWFERLYRAAERGQAVVPWDRGGPHPALVEWVGRGAVDGAGRPAIVVGCGLGDDAELVASLGFRTTAFDVSATAVAAARARYPDSTVGYRVADLLDPPEAWLAAFELVVESQTVQALPRPLRADAIAAVRRLVSPGGTLLVLAGALGDGDPEDGPPWRLTHTDVVAFAGGGLVPVAIESIPDVLHPGAERWRAEFRRDG